MAKTAPTGKIRVRRKDDYTSMRSMLEMGIEKVGVDYDIEVDDLADSKVVIAAPHDGRLEPRTGWIAARIAKGQHSLYRFRARRGDTIKGRWLHVRSENFDEPQCLELVGKNQYVVTIHGDHNKQKEMILIGGLDTILRDRLVSALRNQGLPVKIDRRRHTGTDQNNICNGGQTGQGVQVELTMAFRRNRKKVAQFVQVVRSILT